MLMSRHFLAAVSDTFWHGTGTFFSLDLFFYSTAQFFSSNKLAIINKIVIIEDNIDVGFEYISKYRDSGDLKK